MYLYLFCSQANEEVDEKKNNEDNEEGECEHKESCKDALLTLPVK